MYPLLAFHFFPVLTNSILCQVCSSKVCSSEVKSSLEACDIICISIVQFSCEKVLETVTQLIDSLLSNSSVNANTSSICYLCAILTKESSKMEGNIKEKVSTLLSNLISGSIFKRAMDNRIYESSNYSKLVFSSNKIFSWKYFDWTFDIRLDSKLSNIPRGTCYL